MEFFMGIKSVEDDILRQEGREVSERGASLEYLPRTGTAVLPPSATAKTAASHATSDHETESRRQTLKEDLAMGLMNQSFQFPITIFLPPTCTSAHRS